MARRFLALVLLVAVTAALLRPTVAQTPPPTPGRPPRIAQPAAPTPKKGKVAAENQLPGGTSWKSEELSRGRGTPLSEPLPAPATPATSAAPNRAAPAAPAAPATTLTAAWADTAAIKGYAGATSINKGSAIALYISTTKASYRLDIYRMGYYGGSGARLLSSVASLPGQNQAAPAPDANGMVAAN